MSEDDFDVENLLRATLSERARQIPHRADFAEQIIAETDHPRPVRELRPRRWQGWTLPAVAAAAVAAVVGIVIGLAQIHQADKHSADHRVPATPPPVATNSLGAYDEAPSSGPSPATSPTAPTAPTSSVSGLSTGASTVLPGGAVGPNFHAVDLTFTGTQDGWALGTSGCLDGTPGTCPTILHTADGGTDWSSIQIPPAPIARECGSPCVTNLRFANAKVGYAFGPGTLYMTTNGGSTWGANQGDTSSLEVANGTALRISGGVLELAAVGTTRWSPAIVPSGTQFASQLVRSSHYAYAESVAKAASGSGTARQSVIASTDNGKTWADRGDPCDHAKPALDVAQLATGADGSLTVLCQDLAATKTGAPTRSLVTSTDGGLTFSAAVPLPATSAEFSFGAVSASVLFYVADKLYRSDDGGQTWSVVAAPPGQAAVGGSAFLGFESDTTGRWVPGDGSTIFTTTDAGQHWTPFTFG